MTAKTFQERLLKALEGLDLPDREFARAMSASLTTIRRWKDGTSWPHPMVEKIVFRFLEAERKDRDKSSL